MPRSRPPVNGATNSNLNGVDTMAKRILFVLSTWLLICLLILPQAAANIDLFLSSYQTELHLLSIEELILVPAAGWKAVLAEFNVLRIYLLMALILAVMFFLLVAKGTGVDYQSRMQRITPDIATPYPDGQGQFGTARWMEKGEMKRIFTPWRIPKCSPLLRRLRMDGKSDKKEIQNAIIHID